MELRDLFDVSKLINPRKKDSTVRSGIPALRPNGASASQTHRDSIIVHSSDDNDTFLTRLQSVLIIYTTQYTIYCRMCYTMYTIQQNVLYNAHYRQYCRICYTMYIVHYTAEFTMQCTLYSIHFTAPSVSSNRHQICDFEMRVNEMLAIVVLYYN